MIVGYFSTPLSPIDRSSKNTQKKKKKKQRNLRIKWHYRPKGLTRHLQSISSRNSTFFSAHILSKIDHILGHKANLNKYKTTEITVSITSEIKLI
jgi:hypothetical protein